MKCVEKYCQLANLKIENLKSVETPCMDDHQFNPEDFESKGELGGIAARVVLKALYVARLGRPDCLWTINHLARYVTDWNKACDKR